MMARVQRRRVPSTAEYPLGHEQCHLLTSDLNDFWAARIPGANPPVPSYRGSADGSPGRRDGGPDTQHGSKSHGQHKSGVTKFL